LEETGLDYNYFEPENLNMIALIADTNFAGSKHSRPELVARLSVSLNYREIENIQQESVRKKGFKEEDVLGIEPVSKNLISLEQKIKFDGRQMCPPTEAALTYLLYELYEEKEGSQAAFSKIEEFTKTVNNYKREPFKPPIHTLSS